MFLGPCDHCVCVVSSELDEFNGKNDSKKYDPSKLCFKSTLALGEYCFNVLVCHQYRSSTCTGSNTMRDALFYRSMCSTNYPADLTSIKCCSISTLLFNAAYPAGRPNIPSIDLSIFHNVGAICGHVCRGPPADVGRRRFCEIGVVRSR